MLKTQEMVREMLQALEVPVRDTPGLEGAPLERLENLVEEEADEFCEAMRMLRVIRNRKEQWRQVVFAELGEKGGAWDWPRLFSLSDEELAEEMTLYWWSEVIDAICDIIVVVHNASNIMGIDIEPYFAEVHRTNMAKVGGPIRASDGKRLKPEGWEPPDILGMLKRELKGGDGEER